MLSPTLDRSPLPTIDEHDNERRAGRTLLRRRTPTVLRGRPTVGPVPVRTRACYQGDRFFARGQKTARPRAHEGVLITLALSPVGDIPLLSARAVLTPDAARPNSPAPTPITAATRRRFASPYRS